MTKARPLDRNLPKAALDADVGDLPRPQALARDILHTLAEHGHVTHDDGAAVVLEVTLPHGGLRALCEATAALDELEADADLECVHDDDGVDTDREPQCEDEGAPADDEPDLALIYGGGSTDPDKESRRTT